MSDPSGSAADNAKLDAARRALLARRLKGGSAAASNTPPPAIPTLPADARVAASPAQAQLLFLDELHPDTAAYHISLVLHSPEGFDESGLATALARLVERHESLRTVFRMREGRPEQIVRDPWAPRIGRHRADAAQLDATLRKLAGRPFSTTLGPLLRADVVTTGERAGTLLITVHHLVADEWSLGILLTELDAEYRAACDGRSAHLEPPPVTYRDYSAWQAARLEELAAPQLDYWREALDGAPRELALPVDRARPAHPSLRGAWLSTRVDAATDAALDELGRALGATPFMVWLAAYAVLLSRYCGQDDVVVGVPAANRATPELERVVGLFLNTLPLRVRLDGAGTFRELVQRVREAAMGAFAHQDVPLERIVADLAPTREAAHNPLFQAMFVLEGESAGGADLGSPWRRRSFDAGHAKFDLTLFVHPDRSGSELSIEYATDLFETRTAQAMLDGCASLVARLAAEPDRELGTLPTLDQGQRQALLELYREPAGDADRSAGTYARIERWFRFSPDATAIVADGQHLTYAELNARSERVAAALRASGVGRGDIVALLLPRGADTLAAMLAAWRLGAAYAPLDPAYPPARNAAIVADLGMGRDAPVPVLAMAADDPMPQTLWLTIDAALESTAAPPAAATHEPDDLAYVIYTSGTTADPKGVCITHANLAQSNAARLDYYATPPQRFLVVSPFAFDSSVAGIFWALASGQTLVVAPADEAADVRVLAALIEREQVTHTLMLPSLYRLLLSAAESRRLASLDTVIVAGEGCPAALVEAHFDALPQTRLYNEYGPTEGCVWATVHRCTRDDRDPVPIGRPIPAAAACVVDASGDLAPRGVTGELALAGPGVSPGYLHDADKTAARFPADPWFGGDGARLYLSGDLVRLRADDRFEFIGRRDDQVKLRGHRIEPGEIETRLRAIDGVRDAAVRLVGDGDDAQLAAFVETDGEADDTARLLTTALRGQLPSYMVPSRIVAMPSLPRSPTGKVDRAALLVASAPAAANESQAGGQQQAAWRDDVERELGGIWRQVLKREDVRRDSDFFELGGHSLLGLSVMLEIERRLKIVLPLTALFEAPRLSELAARVRDGQVNARRHVVAIRGQGSKPPVVCVHGGARVLARHLDRDRPILLAFQEIADANPELISIESMAEEYLAEVRRMYPQGPYTLVGFSLGGKIAWEMARQLRASGDPASLLILCDPAQDSRIYYGRKARQFISRWRSAGSPLAMAQRAIADVAAVGARRLSRSGTGTLRRLFVASGRKLRWLTTVGAATLGLGVLTWLAAGAWMNAPQWQIVALPLAAAPGVSSNRTFTPPASGRYELTLEVDRRVPDATLQRAVLPLRQPATVEVDWRVASGAQTAAAGDVSGYLFLDYGPQSPLGRLRSLAMRDPHGIDRAYMNTLGLFGSRFVARGVAGFELQRGQSYVLGATTGAGLDAIAAGQPRMVLRPARIVFERHYDTVAPWLYASFALTAIGGLLLLIGLVRGRHATPAEALIVGEEQQYGRLSARYHYAPYTGRVAMVLPSGYREYEKDVRGNWARLVDGPLTIEILDDVHGHVDMIKGESGERLAEFVSGMLDDTPAPAAGRTNTRSDKEAAV